MAISKKSFIFAGILLIIMLSGMLRSFDFTDIGTMFGSSAPVKCEVSSSPTDWIPLAYVALLLGLIIVGAGYALSGLVGGPKVNDWLKGTLWTVVETAAILSVLSLAFAGLQEFGVKNIDTARTYSAVIRNTVIFDFGLMVWASMMFSFISKQKPQIKMPFLKAYGLNFQLSPMFRPIFDGLGMMVQLIAAAIAEWFGHEFMLCFIKNTMLAVLLPIGIFLRAFGPPRAGANALIGLALALYFIYPFLLVQTGEMLTKYFENEALAANPQHVWAMCNTANKPICCSTPSGTITPSTESEPFIANGPRAYDPWPSSQPDRLSQKGVLEGDIVMSFDGLVPVVGSGAFCIYNTVLAKAAGGVARFVGNLGIWTVPGAAIGIALLNTVLRVFNLSWIAISLLPVMMVFVLYAAYEIIFFLFVVSLVLPIFVIFITITLAKEIAKTLGTEIDLSALEKLI